MICPNCQTQLPDDARNCYRCGAGLMPPPQQSVPYSSPSVQAVTPARKGFPTTLLVVGILGVMGVLIAGLGVAGFVAYRYYFSALTPAAALEMLPPGDAVTSVDVHEIVHTIAPRVLADSPDQLAEFNKALDEAKKESGIDPRQIEHLTMSVTVPPSGGDPQVAAIVTGSFDAESLKNAFQKIGDKFETTDYKGYTVYVQTKGKETLGITMLNMQTIAVGFPVESLHKVLDAHGGSGTPMAADLREAFTATSSDATLRVAARVPKNLTDVAKSEGPPGLADLFTAKVYFGWIDAAKDIELEVAARLDSADRAQRLKTELESLKTQFKQMLVDNPSKADFEKVLDSIAVTTQGSDLHVRLVIPESTAKKVVNEAGPMI